MDNQRANNVEALLTDQYALASSIPFLIVGTLGNILTLFVLHRPIFRDKSFAVFLRALAFADTGMLWLNISTIRIFNLGSTAMEKEWQIRVRLAFYSLFGLASSWTLVLVTLERVIIVYRPEKAKVLCTKTKAVWGVFLTWVILGIACLIFATASPTEDILTDSYEKFLTFVIFYSILPALAILPCNISIIVRLHRARAARLRLTPGTANMYTPSTDKATAMLVTNSFVFVFATFTAIIILVINITVPLPITVLRLGDCLTKANHAINFILYCVSGATFRTELKLMFQSLVHTEKRPEALPSPGVNTISSRVHKLPFAFGSDMKENEEHHDNVKQSTRL